MSFVSLTYRALAREAKMGKGEWLYFGTLASIIQFNQYLPEHCVPSLVLVQWEQNPDLWCSLFAKRHKVGISDKQVIFPKSISLSLVEDLTVLLNGRILCHPTPLKPSANPSNGLIHAAAAGFLRSCQWAPRMQTRAQSWLLTPCELWGRTRRHLLGEGPQRHHRRENWMPHGVPGQMQKAGVISATTVYLTSLAHWL